jgi:hypothetical protein
MIGCKIRKFLATKNGDKIRTRDLEFRRRRAILNLTPGPQGWNLSPRENIHPFVPPRGKHSLLFRRMEGRTENSTPRGKLYRQGTKFTTGGQLRPQGQSLPLGVKLRMGLCEWHSCHMCWLVPHGSFRQSKQGPLENSGFSPFWQIMTIDSHCVIWMHKEKHLLPGLLPTAAFVRTGFVLKIIIIWCIICSNQ